jgi:hypothetical protein
MHRRGVFALTWEVAFSADPTVSARSLRVMTYPAIQMATPAPIVAMIAIQTNGMTSKLLMWFLPSTQLGILKPSWTSACSVARRAPAKFFSRPPTQASGPCSAPASRPSSPSQDRALARGEIEIAVGLPRGVPILSHNRPARASEALPLQSVKSD